MKRFVIAIAFLFSANLHAQAPCAMMAYGAKLPRTTEQHVVLCKKEFAIGYSTQKRSPLFIVQRLDPAKRLLPDAISFSPFRPDPTISQTQQPSLADFSNSGFDRGHMSPFEDNDHDVIAGTESNYLTNVVPQNPSNNRGIWRVLEAYVRNISGQEIIYVVTGPIYEKGNNTVIGANQTRVPSHLFKIIVIPRTRRTVTYIIPNRAVPSEMLPSFMTTRAKVRELTGIDPVPVGGLTDSR